MFQLERYKTKDSRYKCPACGHKNVFARYVDEAGNHIAPEVGRCNRESKCGYHLRLSDYFAQNPSMDWTPKPTTAKPPSPALPLMEIPAVYFEKSQAARERNAFVRFLMSRYDHTDVMRVCEAYGVGDFEGFTTFWRKDTAGSLWTAKLIKYNATTGKRQKDDYSTSWMHSVLGKRSILPKNCDYQRVLFGAHLLTDSTTTIAIVEAEKTAIIAALELPDFLWLASGGRTQINAEKLQAFGQRRVLLFPDGDSFDQWSELASKARASGANVVVSDLLETELTEDQKADGYDLADYFLMDECENSHPTIEAEALNPMPDSGQQTPFTNEPAASHWAELYAGHCKQCGDYLQPSGDCNLCRQPLPF